MDRITSDNGTNTQNILDKLQFLFSFFFPDRLIGTVYPNIPSFSANYI